MNIFALLSPHWFRLFAGVLVPVSLACALVAPAIAADSSARTPVLGSAWITERQPEIADFNAWAMKYAKQQNIAGTTTAPSAETLAEGVRLAERRRPVLSALIFTDPARALAICIPAVVREKMPAAVLSRLETPFSGTGDYFVNERSRQRELTIDGRTYNVHARGEQLALASQSGASLRGFALDGEAVLDTGAGGKQTHSRPVKHTRFSNDPFAGALQLFGTGDSVFDDNVGATKEPGEPNHAGSPGGASVWYVWTPTSSGQATFTTDDGSNGVAVDTLLAVYTGNDVAALSSVVSDDDSGVGFNSEVSFFARAGTTYHIAVDGYLYTTGISQGAYTLTFVQQGDPFSPAITSDSVVESQVNEDIFYTITATNSPTSFSATGLPAGLTLDPRTGVISGRVATIGNYIVVLSASNDLGTGSARLVIAVSDLPVHFPFFRTEVALPQSPGFYYLHLPNGNIFGYYAYLDDTNFIYHLDLGFEYTFDAGDGKSGIYLYDFASSTYFYTSPRFPFPYMYDFSLQAFVYYFPDPRREARYNTDGIRYFYNFSTGEIITK